MTYEASHDINAVIRVIPQSRSMSLQSYMANVNVHKLIPTKRSNPFLSLILNNIENEKLIWTPKSLESESQPYTSP